MPRKKKAVEIVENEVAVQLKVDCVTLPNRNIHTIDGRAMVSQEELAQLKEMGVVIGG